ncbi:MAG: hypothetical protein J6C58_06515, partial [Bacteroidaceae bacterium]|nr:hypothetical protein [Bacteroidaceae bacterium]
AYGFYLIDQVLGIQQRVPGYPLTQFFHRRVSFCVSISLDSDIEYLFFLLDFSDFSDTILVESSLLEVLGLFSPVAL